MRGRRPLLELDAIEGRVWRKETWGARWLAMCSSPCKSHHNVSWRALILGEEAEKS